MHKRRVLSPKNSIPVCGEEQQQMRVADLQHELLFSSVHDHSQSADC